MTETKSYTVEFRGDVNSLVSVKNKLVFATEHSEGQSTEVFVFDVDKGTATSNALDTGALAYTLVDGDLWLVGTDGVLRRGAVGKKLSKVGDAFDDRVEAITACQGGAALVEGANLHIVDAKGNRTTFDLGERGRSVAADPTGQWLVAGTRRGTLVVFDGTSGSFGESSRGKVHDGDVTALAFMPDELRAVSAGADNRLLVSFVRGSFDTEDRGGNNGHTEEVRAILMGPDFVTAEGTNPRFFTVGLDSVIKSWPRARTGSQRPASYDQGVVRTQALAMVDVDKKPALAAAGLDGTVRIFGFDEVGRVDRTLAIIRGAYALAEQNLGSSKPKDREAALADLASYADSVAVQLMRMHLSQTESDHKVLAKGVSILAKVDHSQVAGALFALLSHSAAGARTAALEGLLSLDSVEPLTVLQKALDAGHEDLGVMAVDAAVELGTPAAGRLLVRTLDHGSATVRLASAGALEKFHGDDAQGTLFSLTASQADVRRFGLSRALSRGIFAESKVASRLRRLWDDDDERVRLWSFVVATHRSKSLVAALRAADEDFHRQVFELEQLGVDEKKRKKAPPAAKAFDTKKLSEADLRPLLEALGSRSVDVSLRGARLLAVLGDARALGTLLQLSRDGSPAPRIGACRALAVLEDPRALSRVRAMLHDSDDQVRDAAFGALVALESGNPLAAASAGLAATAVDVRERALALLVKSSKSAKARKADETVKLFAAALNDGDAALRQEAFKSVYNLEIGGGGTDTLRFVLASSHVDVRREVLQETKSKPKDTDYRGLQLELLADDDASLRLEAFNHALTKWPSKEHDALFRAGLNSPHSEMRRFTVQKLSEEKEDGLRKLLLEALRDETVDVRIEAVRALVRGNNRELLAGALDSSHLDVRVEAATALAAIGDQRALQPLIDVVQGYHDLLEREAPEQEVATYKPRLESALKAIAALGAPEAIDTILSLLDGDSGVANAAAASLAAIAGPSNLDKIRPVTRHESQTIRFYAALALAYSGDPSHAGLIFGQTSPTTQLFAAFCLREDSPERFLAFVDQDDERVRSVALALILALELTEHTQGGAPERCVSLLSAKNPFIRLAAAEALEHYRDQPAFYKWVYAMLNGIKSPADAWKAEPAQLLALSRAVTLGGPRVAIRAAQVLAQLTSGTSDSFDALYAAFHAGHADELARLEKLANTEKSAPLAERFAAAWKRVKASAKSLAGEPQSFDEALSALAFGAFAGLTRDQTDHRTQYARGAAIDGLVRLAELSDRTKADAKATIIMALGDPTQYVREKAFDRLVELGFDHEILIDEAMSTPFADLWRRALVLSASAGGGVEVLERVIRESDSDVAYEAETLLVDRTSENHAWTVSLESAAEGLRSRAVRRLAARCLHDDDAMSALHEALQSDFDDVRFDTARELASRQQGEAYDTLIELLSHDDASDQQSAANALQQLKDERSAPAILARITDDANGTAATSRLLDYLAEMRDPAVADTLLDFVDDGKFRNGSYDALLKISGYDQYDWMDDDEVTPKWEATLEPRRPEVFASLFSTVQRTAWSEKLGDIVGKSKWPPKNDVIDRTLSALTTFSDANVRARAIEISGWRLRHREGAADALRDALQSREPLDQFYAAEGLALAGHGDGLAVLRTAADAMDDWSLRERSIKALGVLADDSTVDMLLTMANDPMHEFQLTAAEAIGHMSESPRADEVFETLRTLAGGSDPSTEAMNGLRWFGTPGAWDLLRNKARSDSWWIANTAVELLRYDADSVDIIAEVLRENDDWDVAETAAESLRHVYGPDSLEPDFLVLEANVEGIDAQDEALKRLREKGETGRILDTISKVHEDNVDEFVPKLVAIVLSRDPLPLEAAAERLSSEKALIASIAAQIVGRGGKDASKKYGKALVAGAQAQREAWDAAWADFIANRRGGASRIAEIGPAYRRFVWALGQLETGKPELLAAATLPDHPKTLGVREDAIASLGEPWFGKEGISTLRDIASGTDARLRAMAAAELERCAPKESATLLEKSRHDDVAYGRLLGALDEKTARTSLRGALDDVAGVALPRLAALKDVEGLVAAVRNDALADATRQGALDALSRIPTSEVADALAKFGADEKQDELLRKAAWRARRRVTRAVAAQEAK